MGCLAPEKCEVKFILATILPYLSLCLDFLSSFRRLNPVSNFQEPSCCQLIIAFNAVIFSEFCILIGPPGIKMFPEPKEWISNGGILGICDRHCGSFSWKPLRRQTPWQPSSTLMWYGRPCRGIQECELISNEIVNFIEKKALNFANYSLIF